MKPILLTILLMLSMHISGAEYVGAEACGACHQTQLKQWQKSDHFHAMQIANSASVLGDFSDVEVEFHGIKTRFFKRQDSYFIETLDEDSEVRVLKVLYAFGHDPLQQYLVDIGSGKLQAFSIAWDSRSKKNGGQRWFHLQPQEDISPAHPFFWQGHFQNWNSRCAECHSTDLRKNYDPESNSYDSQWSEINVACEACHGPGSDHITLAHQDAIKTEDTGLIRIGKRTPWLFVKDDSIANPQRDVDESEIDICGGCHSRRLPIATHVPGAAYHDENIIRLLSPGLYFPDGQIEDEVFVLGSFLQSKMYQQGVRCTDCHNPHSGEVKIPGNNLCSQCHLATTYDDPDHHGHQQNTQASQCVNCHMPARTYMGVDDRRDHSFVVPRQLTENATTPSPCTDCHKAQSRNWINKSIKVIAKDHWSTANTQSRNFDMQSVRGLATHAADQSLAPIVRASLIEQLANYPSRFTLEAVTRALTNTDPMIRGSAIAALGFLPAADRWTLLEPFANDESKSVRFQVAATMADALPALPEATRDQLAGLISEYKQALKITEDSPATQIAQANLAMQQNQLLEAEQHFQRALQISPGFVPALLNFAEFLRNTNRNAASEQHLQKALSIAPDSAGAQHAWGLHLVRQQRIEDALPFLRIAATIADAQPRFSYVFAVALDSIGATDQALSHLKASDQRWPNQIDTLNALLIYADKQNELASHMQYLSKLSALSPSSPLVRRLMQKYQSR